jgi:hypothetical protein
MLFFISREEYLKLAIRCNQDLRIPWLVLTRGMAMAAEATSSSFQDGLHLHAREPLEPSVGCVAIDVILRLSVEGARLGIW